MQQQMFNFRNNLIDVVVMFECGRSCGYRQGDDDACHDDAEQGDGDGEQLRPWSCRSVIPVAEGRCRDQRPVEGIAPLPGLPSANPLPEQNDYGKNG